MFNSEVRQQFRRRALLIALFALVIVYILWNVPAFDPIIYPLRLFVTYIHEAGHGLMALLTGGRIVGFVVQPDGSGVTSTIGGSRALTLPAGYLGAAFFGAVLFYLVNHVRYTRPITFVLGAWMLVFTTLFARPDQAGTPTAILVGWLGGLALLGMGWKLPPWINLLVLNVLAMITSLNAVLDVFSLTRIISRGSLAAQHNDAAYFSAEIAPLIPAVIWAWLWAGLALIMLGISVYFSVIRPFRRGKL